MPKNTKPSLRVAYAETVFGDEERTAVKRVLADPHRIVAGPAVAEFERKIARMFGKEHGVMVNSGSSANLLALEVLDLPEGSEVITPVLTFSTTLAPILQKRLVPVFADIEPGTYLINIKQVESLITRRTSALMIPSLLGNIPDFRALQHIARKHKLRLIEDSCDTLGATFMGKPTGSFSDVSTTSFYASHIITAAGSGGMVCFHDANLARRSRIMGYWGRDSTLFGSYEKSEEMGRRFSGRLAGQPYDAKFVFSEVGYNMQPTELQGAFGLAQLKRYPLFAKRRRKNFDALIAFFSRYQHCFVLPRQHPKASTPWLAYPLTLKEGMRFNRIELAQFLEEQNIQTRPIFTGNVLRQPAFRALSSRAVCMEEYPVADAIMRNGILVGCHHGMGTRHLRYLQLMFTRFLSEHGYTPHR